MILWSGDGGDGTQWAIHWGVGEAGIVIGLRISDLDNIQSTACLNGLPSYGVQFQLKSRQSLSYTLALFVAVQTQMLQLPSLAPGTGSGHFKKEPQNPHAPPAPPSCQN